MRRRIVSAVRRGETLREVAERFGVSVKKVWRWSHRAASERLDRLDLCDRRRGPPPGTGRVSPEVEQTILRTRRELRDTSALGEYGAVAIRREMLRAGAAKATSVRTIGRVLARHGVVERKRRVRRPPPPRGWYLPDVAAGHAELDGFDVISHLATSKDKHIEVLTGLSLHGRIPMAVVCERVSTRNAMPALIARWRQIGLPCYAQFDNDTRFTGITTAPDVFGRMIRLCLSLGVVPVFAAPREHGFQNFVEGFNARWKAVIRERLRPDSLAATQEHSARFVDAARKEHGVTGRPSRRSFPPNWELDLQAPLEGVVIFIRRSDEDGRVRVLGRSYETASAVSHSLVRCEVDLTRGEVRFVALDRARPTDQPLVRTAPYAPVRRGRFYE